MNSFALSEAGLGPLGYVLAFGVALAGALLVHLLRRGPRRYTGMPAPTPSEAPLPPADPDYPDWRQYDQPSLSLDQLGALMRDIAVRARIPQRLLPHLGPIAGPEGTFLERDKFDYIYIGLERGVPMFDRREVIADKTMYQVFSDIAFGLAVNKLIESGVSAATDEQIADERQAILARIDRRWGNQFALDRAHEAGRRGGQ